MENMSPLVALSIVLFLPLCSANIPSARNYGSFPLARLTLFSKVVVGEESTVVVGLKPMVEMDLIEVGRNKFLSQFVSLAA